MSLDWILEVSSLITQKKILEELIIKDRKLSKILDNKKKCPFFKKPIIEDDVLFLNLAQSIVGQQISVKAADAIWERMISYSDNKKTFLEFISKSKLRWARDQGLSKRKYEYIKLIAKSIISKKASLESIKDLSDDDAKELLLSFKGIGPWTSEMFLMFAYKRLDIFSVGDFALRKAISEIYNVSRDDHRKIIKISDKWKPYRSVVCWYLWEYLDV